ncbi:ribonucleotide reductase N-terminal alpha domain-containing protein [Staphylococcus hyicus]|uniref:ribonucleotide reductase N-terminal alpha domain-containing protein n=1 Tax=Staphylococcus hyicus TaxID=1284 RepID=UPI002738E0BC|nr:LAGLIDADG family homing endonuclease [Staphylococcus hyicus]MDP4468627.1 LAGLIDADG family homing endonuclease [Staphylococcus hyicus]
MNYIELNNQMLQRDNITGQFKLEKDKEATKDYFLNNINLNTVFFHTLKEKLDYLVENDYYEKEPIEKYSYKDLKKLYKYVYNKKFRFESFMAAQMFYERYALRTNDGKRILERYEDRIVANAIVLGDGDIEKAFDYAKLLINQEYQPATPTFMNLLKKRGGNYVSCFLLEVDDSLNDLNAVEGYAKQLSKLGGGVSLNLSKIRAKGESIQNIEGVASGVVPFMKSLDQSARWINQLGSRQGAFSVYLNAFHADIYDFLDTKRISGDEDIRCKTLSLGVVIPDKFIELAAKDKMGYLFYPHNVKQVYGTHFDEMDITKMYDELVDNPTIKKKQFNPRQLMSYIGSTLFESGYPYLMFSDNVNRVHANNNVSKVKFSNLCVTGDTELLTDNGYFSAKELYDKQNKLKVVIDKRTKNYDIREKGTEVVNAIPMQLTSRKADVFEIKTKQGYSIKSTEWHKYYKQNDDKSVSKVQLNELSVGDRLLIQSGEGKFGSFHDPELAFIMGIIAGDGTFADRGTPKIYLYDSKKSLKDKLEKMIHNVIDRYHNKEIDLHHSATREPKFVYNEKMNRLELSSSVLRDVLNKHGFNKENKISFPYILKQANKQTISSYLSGLYQMDGTVNANAKSKAMSYELVSISKEFLKDIQMQLLNLGIYSSIYKTERTYSLLPDSNRNLKEYKVSNIYKLSVQDRKSRDKFLESIELKEKDVKKVLAFNSILQPNSRTPKHGFTATIESIEYIGKEDVYDTTQEDYHSLIFNGIVTGNCSEILQYSQVSEHTDYGLEDKLGLDISCNLGSLNIVNAMKSEDFGKTIALSIDALNEVSRISNIANAPTIKKANEISHSIGLGAMNLHGYLAQNKIKYDSKEGLEFADTFFRMVKYYGLKRSMDIAKETGEKYYGFEGSKYASGEQLKDYFEQKPPKISDKIAVLFEGHHIPTQEDWKKLSDDIQKYGLYNSYITAVAPTGSISYIQNSTASILPVVERIEERPQGKSKVYFPAPNLSAENWFFYKEAYDFDQRSIADMVATIQKHVDQGISFTYFMKDTDTTRDINKLHLYAYSKGIKTMYYMRTKRTQMEECLSCQV